jgi:transposase InsO family protein
MKQFNINKGVVGSKTVYENIIRSRIPEKDKEKVKQRLRVLDHAQKFGIKSAIDAYRVCERTIKYWRKKLRESHGVYANLAPQTTKPVHSRKSKIPQRIKEYIRDLKKSKPKIGKEKIVKLLETDTGYILSAGSVWNIIQYWKRRGEIPDKVRYSMYARTGNLIIRKHRKGKVKIRRKEYVPVNFGDLIQVDTIIIFILGKKYYILTAIDIFNRLAYAYVSNSHSSKTAEVFLKGLSKIFGYEVKRVQTDNGSEFAKHFDGACKQLNITHFWNYPRHPKQNAFIERFNRTIQEEWVKPHQSLFINGEIDKLNEELTKWLTWYNTVRPHWGLHLETPRGYTERINNQRVQNVF